MSVYTILDGVQTYVGEYVAGVDAGDIEEFENDYIERLIDSME